MDARGRINPLALALPLVVLTAVACKKPPPDTGRDAAPPDRLAPGEAAEGRQRAYALALPLASNVRSRYGGTVGVVSELSPEQLSNFVRARVKEGHVVSGTSSTRFEDVVVPSEPTRRLTIDVRPTRPDNSGNRSEMTVEDVTPVPIQPGLSEEERWKQKGLRPDGQLLDKTHLQ